MSKLTLHVIGAAPGWAAEFVNVAQPAAMKGLNWCPDFPGVEGIVRIYVDETVEPEPLAGHIRQGAAGANIVWGHVWPEIQKLPAGALLELYNEAPIWDPSVLAGFAAFNQRLIQLAHEHGRRICVGAINTGWPNESQYPVIYAAVQGADAMSLHEYSPETYMVGHRDICHYRHFHAWGQARGLTHPPIYITECGLDRTGGPDHGHFSWRTILQGNEEAYVEQLARYEQELRKDDYVVAATIFTTGGDWPEFEFGQSVAMKLARRLAELGPVPEPTPPDPPEEQMNLIPNNCPFWVNELRGALPWHASKRWAPRDTGAIRRIVVHHTATEPGVNQTVRQHIEAINRGHIGKGWPRIGYHLLIGAKGVFWPVNDPQHITYHASGANSDSLGVCLIGDFSTGAPTPEQREALRWLVQNLGLPAVGHREVGSTTCPGPWWEAWKEWVNGPFEPSPPEEPGNDDQDDGGEPVAISYKDKDGKPLTVEAGGVILSGEQAWKHIYGEGCKPVAVDGAKYRIVELWDSGPEAGMDAQIEVRGGYPEGAQAVIVEPGGEVAGNDKGPGVQEVLLWHAYAPPNVGGDHIYIRDPERRSDRLEDVGWLAETNHRHPQRVVFELIEGAPEPPEEEPTDPEPPEEDHLAQAREHLLAGKAHLEEALGHLELAA